MRLNKIDYLLKHNRFFFFLYFVSFSLLFRLLGLFIPVKKNRILFTGHGMRFNDSPRKIYERMASLDSFKDFDFYWALKDTAQTVPGPAKIVRIDSFKYFVVALSSQYWVACVNIERGLRFKKRSTIYLNTWHGTPIKSIDGGKQRKNDNFSYINLFCTSGTYEKAILKKVFSIKEAHFIETGLPRNDELYHANQEDIIRIRNKLGLPNDKKIVLYAPTWRESLNNGKDYNLIPPLDFNKWKRVIGDKYVVLVRIHPYTTSVMGIEFDDFVRDFSNYDNVNELLVVSDVLISDYSAIIFDYSILEKPLICFAYDYEEYRDTRGLSLDLEKEMPGGIVKNEDEVLHILCNFKEKYELMSQQTKAFKNKYLEFGGNATDICINELLSKRK